MRIYHPFVFAAFVSLCVLGFVLLGIASSLPQYQTVNQVLSAIGTTLLVADMMLVLIADWKGFLTLNGRLNWSAMSAGKRMLFGILYGAFGPILLVMYLAQIARYKAPQAVAPHEAQQ
jgi:hypothetical protein